MRGCRRSECACADLPALSCQLGSRRHTASLCSPPRATSLSATQLSNNFIRRIDNLHLLPALQTLQLAHNQLATADDVRGLLHAPQLSVVDLSHNRLDDVAALGVLCVLPQLAVLQLHGNPVVQKIEQYRRTVVSRCRALTYLDDRPVFPEDRLAIEAWAWAEAELGKGRGLEAEREERARQREARDEQQRLNIEYMRTIAAEAKERAAARLAEAGVAPSAHAQVAEAAARGSGGGQAGSEAEHSSQQLYNRALAAVEAKRCARARSGVKRGIKVARRGLFAARCYATSALCCSTSSLLPVPLRGSRVEHLNRAHSLALSPLHPALAPSAPLGRFSV